MLARGQVEDNRLPRVYESLDRNAQTQAQLIADVLDVSRIITGKLQLQPRVIDLCDVVARAADTVRPAAAAKSIHVTLQAPADCSVYGDPERLQQVFWNLLSNAIKFTAAGGSVDVEMAIQERSVSVAVVDSGIGIAREFVPFVFDRFRQADQTTTRSYGGLGLGLSIVKHLTELHGGTVNASSLGPGRGARFEVRLPAAEAGSRPHKPESAPVNRVSLDGRSILVVDDDASTREVVAAALEAAHAEVEVAASAEEARQRLQQHAPELVIADIGMPIEDGFSLIRRMREGEAREVPAIALSAYADQTSRDAALAAGFNAFLAKPTRTDALLQLVSRLLKDAEASKPANA
jgi:CheY-like chemotaxis protein